MGREGRFEKKRRPCEGATVRGARGYREGGRASAQRDSRSRCLAVETRRGGGGCGVASLPLPRTRGNFSAARGGPRRAGWIGRWSCTASTAEGALFSSTLRTNSSSSLVFEVLVPPTSSLLAPSLTSPHHRFQPLVLRRLHPSPSSKPIPPPLLRPQSVQSPDVQELCTTTRRTFPLPLPPLALEAS